MCKKSLITIHYILSLSAYNCLASVTNIFLFFCPYFKRSHIITNDNIVFVAYDFVSFWDAL